MLCRFKVNLGSVDAAKLDLDFKACLVGAEVEVNEEAGKSLVAAGIAIDITPPKPIQAPSPLKAIPPVDLKAADEPTEANTAPPSPKKKT